MDRQLKKISISFALSCLLLEFGYGSTPCQNGFDYNNKCDPYYNINLIKAKVSSDSNKASRRVVAKRVKNLEISSKVAIKIKEVQKQSDLSYLDTLRRKYSNQFDGKMGLQALIDRSQYLNLKKIDKITKEETTQVKANNKAINTKHTSQKEKDEKSIVSKDKTALSLNVNKQISKPHNSKHKTAKKSTQNKKNKSYIVKKGDTLIKIARKFSVNKNKIITLNKLDKNATIKIGQKLILPKYSKVAKLDSKVKKPKKPIKTIDKSVYVVKSGDTLSLIAKKNNISIVKLRELNRLGRSSRIKIGQKLTLKTPKIKRVTGKTYNYVKNMKFKRVPSLKFKRKIRVVATAYTSHRGQTDKTPFLAAWNNHIRPGMKIIAVSPDLIKKYGLTNGVKVKILGLPGYYVVRDKMNARLRNHIDIYMGVNKRRALQWGRKRIVLYW